jgi:hypothetical protein
MRSGEVGLGIIPALSRDETTPLCRDQVRVTHNSLKTRMLFLRADELTVWQHRHKCGVAGMITKHTVLILLEFFSCKFGPEQYPELEPGFLFISANRTDFYH